MSFPLRNTAGDALKDMIVCTNPVGKFGEDLDLLPRYDFSRYWKTNTIENVKVPRSITYLVNEGTHGKYTIPRYGDIISEINVTAKQTIESVNLLIGRQTLFSKTFNTTKVKIPLKHGVPIISLQYNHISLEVICDDPEPIVSVNYLYLDTEDRRAVCTKEHFIPFGDNFTNILHIAPGGHVEILGT